MFEKIYKSGPQFKFQPTMTRREEEKLHMLQKNKSSEYESDFTKYPKIDKTKSTLTIITY